MNQVDESLIRCPGRFYNNYRYETKFCEIIDSMKNYETPDWGQIKRYLRRAGHEIMAVAEASFETWRDPETPDSVKLALAGGLAYLILPTDLIPDFLPMGFSDDLSILLGVIALAGSVGKKHLAKSRIKRDQ